MARNRVMIVLGALALILVSVSSVLITVLVMNAQRNADLVALRDFQPTYAVEGVTVVNDPEALAEAVEKMSRVVGIGLSYQYDLYSKNGRDFTCYLANDKENGHDMIIMIYGDAGYTDPIFTSKLLRPGTAFENITLDRRLDPGNHDLTVGFTLVDMVDGVQKVLATQAVSLAFHVEDAGA